ncbi:GyrI-like domain-containing protein [Chloroflexota bacterium]
MQKIDLKKELKYLYQPSSKQVTVVDVPRFNFAMLDGQIEAGVLPGNSLDYQNTMGAIYGVAYTLKFMSKLRKNNPIDYPVMPSEGLWWVLFGEYDFQTKELWQYTMMISLPNHITQLMFDEAIAQLKKKKVNPAIDKLYMKSFEEGLCMQIMHIGPYADEPRTIALMAQFAQGHRYQTRGRHHEIYMGDPRRAKPENLKTVLRHPIEKVS